MKEIIDYIKAKHNPHTIIVYGSFVDKTNNADSDFDAMIITDSPLAKHDSSNVCGIQLDLFIHDSEEFSSIVDPENYLMLYDCEIVLDNNGIATKLKKEVHSYIDSYKSDFQKDTFGVNWCMKMLKRAMRSDIEGLFRWHWVLSESLEVYCNLSDKFYFGPKKSLAILVREDEVAANLYKNALEKFSYDTLEVWINHLANIYSEKYKI